MKSYLSLLFLVFLTVHLEAHLLTLGRIAVLTPTSCYTDSFRRQKLPEELYHSMQSKDSDRLPWTDILTVTMLNGQFHPHTISSDSSLYLKYRKESFIQLRNCYKAIWSDIEYFPLSSPDAVFEDTWQEHQIQEKTLHHEGTDIYPGSLSSEIFAVVSMTSGTVQYKSWSPEEHYRISVLTENGGTFYYSCLSAVEKTLKEGTAISPGDILGFIARSNNGSSGISAPYLHFGIFISLPDCDRLTVDPYYILSAVRKKIRNYRY